MRSHLQTSTYGSLPRSVNTWSSRRDSWPCWNRTLPSRSSRATHGAGRAGTNPTIMQAGLPIRAKTRCSRLGLPSAPARLSAWPARLSRRTTSARTTASGTGCATSKRPTPTKPSLQRLSRLGSRQQTTAAFRLESCKPIAMKCPSAPAPGPKTCFAPCETPARRAQSFSCIRVSSSSIRRTATCSPYSAASRRIATGS